MNPTPTPQGTPRTDAELLPALGNNRATVYADFARNLERELSAAQARASALSADLARSEERVKRLLERSAADEAMLTCWRDVAKGYLDAAYRLDPPEESRLGMAVKSHESLSLLDAQYAAARPVNIP